MTSCLFFRSQARVALLAGALLAMSACSNSTAPAAGTSVSFVSPAGGATGVVTNASISVTFSDSMMSSMSAYMSLHQGAVNGPAVAMTPHWSADHRMLTMTPNAPLVSGTMYYLHMGGGMMDANNNPVDYSGCPAMGGQSATSAMMGGMMGGMTGEMGAGWAGTDGNYGWMFTFTTA